MATKHNAAEKLAGWFTSKLIGAVMDSTTKGKRDDSYPVEISTDDANGLVIFTWTPAIRASSFAAEIQQGPPEDNASVFLIHNMARVHNITTGELMVSDMTFEGDTAGGEWLSKRDSVSVSMAYWAASGHADKKLGFDAIADLYLHIFTDSPGGRVSECGYAAKSGTCHGAFKVTISQSTDAGPCTAERQY